MKSWTLSNYLKRNPIIQNMLAYLPLLFVFIYLGFFIADLVNIVGVISYNDDVLSMTDTQYIYPVDVVPTGNEIYVTLKDVEEKGETTVKKGDKILDLVYKYGDVYELQFNGGSTSTIDEETLPEEFNFDKPSDSDITILSLFLGDDGSYIAKYSDNKEETYDKVSFLQFEEKDGEYTFTTLYTKVFTKDNLVEIATTGLDEIGYYLDTVHNTLLHNDGKGAMQTFLNESNILTIVIVFTVYSFLLIFMGRDEELKVLNRKVLWGGYIVLDLMLFVAFVIPYFMY